MTKEVGPARAKLICDACGQPSVAVRQHVQAFPYGEGASAVDLKAVVTVYSCEICGFEYTDDDAEDRRHDAVCAHLGRLNPSAVQAVRRTYDMSRDEFAAVSKLGVASLARWETGSVIQNEAYDIYLRLLADPVIFERVRRIVGAPRSPVPMKKRSFPALELSPRLQAGAQRFRLVG